MSKLRREKSVQFSGDICLKYIPYLKSHHYYIIDVTLDGDAPKQYIKAYFYEKNGIKVALKPKWNGYFAKFGGKSYPHESVVEYLVNKIGEDLGLIMNETKLVIANNQIRFLSKDFITKGKKLIHGIEILAEYFEDKDFVDEINQNKKERRAYLTFDEIENAIRYVYPNQYGELITELLRLITFDAVVGNNDRHFYNWGVIVDVYENNNKVKFAPVYDSARALLWNKTEEKVQKMYQHYKNGSNELDHFVNKSKPRFSFQDNINANHFELVSYLCCSNDRYKKIVQNLITLSNENRIIEKFSDRAERYFSSERCLLMVEILKKRFYKLRQELK